MQSDEQPAATVVAERPNLLARWVRATTIGWLLGFLLVILLAMAWDLVAGGAQFMVGVGMGGGVGLMQARVVGARVPSQRAWVVASTVGMGAPFVLWDLGSIAGLGALFSLPVCALAGALFAGLLQARLLGGPARPRWVLASVLGWGIPVALMAVGDALPRGPGSLLSLPAIFFGGAVLGWVTGKALAGLDR
jgi:hypothetical protein